MPHRVDRFVPGDDRQQTPYFIRAIQANIRSFTGAPDERMEGAPGHALLVLTGP